MVHLDRKKSMRCCGVFFLVVVGTFAGLYLFTNAESALDNIEEQEGLVIYHHPRRYSQPAEWYDELFDKYPDTIVGLEVFNKGDLGYTDRDLWDEINKMRTPEDLVWGFSNDDWHRDSHSFRNYQHMLMNELTETDLRASMESGAFYFSREPNGANRSSDLYGIAAAPKLTNVTITPNANSWNISVEGANYTSIQWFEDDTVNIFNGTALDLSTLEIETLFVRVVLTNEHGETYSQPFGIAEDSIVNPYISVNWTSINHYKANFHAHTTQSDGDDTPAELIERYHGADYQILAIADHSKNTWPWTKWIDEVPERPAGKPSKSAEYYPDLDMLAVSGNEASGGHHFGSLLNDYSGAGLDLSFLLKDLLN